MSPLTIDNDFEAFDNFVTATISHPEGEPLAIAHATPSNPGEFRHEALRTEYGAGKWFRQYSLPVGELGDFIPTEGDTIEAEEKTWVVVRAEHLTDNTRWRLTAMYPATE